MTEEWKKLAWKNILELAKEHRYHCDGKDCKVSLYPLTLLCKYLTGREISYEEFKTLP